MDGLQDFFLSLNGFWGYVFLFASSLAENLFPPMPGDTFVVLGAFLAGRGQMEAVPAYAATTAGSLLGFLLLFHLGRRWGRSFFQKRHGRFFSEKQLDKVESWFERYGYWVIGFNRFLSGARAVVSLAAGIAGMDRRKVTLLAFLSCLIWNAWLMALGIWMGEHWRQILQSYHRILFSVLVMLLLFFVIRRILKRKKTV